MARLVRQAGLSYDDWRYVARRVRQKCDLHPAAKPEKLPRILTADQFRAFYKVVDAAEDVQHALMLRLLFYTAVRVSELCSIEVADVDLENCKIFVNQGKGSKGPLCPLRQVLRHGVSDPRRRPSRRIATCSRPGGAGSSARGVCSRWSSCMRSGRTSRRPLIPSAIIPLPGLCRLTSCFSSFPRHFLKAPSIANAA